MLPPSSKFARDRPAVKPKLPAALDANFMAFERRLVSEEFLKYGAGASMTTVAGFLKMFEWGRELGRRQAK